MKTVVFSDTLKKLSVGQKVYAQGGGQGVISEIRENCAFPVFVTLNSGRKDAFTAAEIFPANHPARFVVVNPSRTVG
ncbi:TPA: hypothetical protein NIB23_001858 [Pseudomonas aeruginosa]|nr:hypothetical protein [Pseudomonas aeruginosa]